MLVSISRNCITKVKAKVKKPVDFVIERNMSINVCEQFRSLTPTTYSIDHRGLIVQNLPHRATFVAPKCAENGKKYGAKPRNCMYLNAEFEIPFSKKSGQSSVI